MSNSVVNLTERNRDYSIFLPSISTFYSNIISKQQNTGTHIDPLRIPSNFENNVVSLKHTWSWLISHVLTILGTSGTSTIKISDQGAMMIEVDSGLIKYEYILPAQVK